ncbi:MAG: right-handed parallel beta-helix repeat-containing protein, partial [Planctomycetes bacterium]|nr:right-handed parallel beta-helix repeat-containing protein [Planctomycetota bacterium]
MGNNNQHVATIATTINFWDENIIFEKTDDVGIIDPNECVSPGYELTYTVCWEMPDYLTLEGARIVDYLPAGVTYPEGYMTTDPNTGWPIWVEYDAYDLDTHTYTWELGTLESNDSGCVTVTVTVSEGAEPSGVLHNVAELVTDSGIWSRDFEDTLVCCWSPVGADANIIYVNADAPGPHSGVSWEYAYADLQDAINRINRSCPASDTIEIWAAEGMYTPGDLEADSFVIPDGVVVYGGFAGNETSRSERSFQRYETILSGYIYFDGRDIIRNTSVVTMGYQSVLDGVTVTGSAEYGVYGNGSDFTVRNCNIEENSQYGIYVKNCDAVIEKCNIAENSQYGIYVLDGDLTLENCKVTDGGQRGIYAQDGNITVKWCSITDNGYEGIYHKGDGFSLTVENSQINRNEYHGIYTINSIPTVKNCIISSNGTVDRDFYGMNIVNPADDPILHNNTIVCNAIEGIKFIDNAGSNWPEIRNCIVYFNN